MASAAFAYESEVLPELEYESETHLESLEAPEYEDELSPIRRIYADGMLEHLAHLAAEAESEDEAAEGFLPLIPMLAGKLLPLAAKALPKLLPKAASTLSRVTPQLTRGVGRITRVLFRNPRTRPYVRAVPTIARRTVSGIIRQAARGQAVTPQAAVRGLTQQTRQVLANPPAARSIVRRSSLVDRHLHRASGTRVPVPTATCSRCCAAPRPVACCPTCGQLIRP